MKNFFNFCANLISFLVISIAMTGIVDVGWEVATKTNMPNGISIFAGILTFGGLFAIASKKIFQEVSGNTALLTTDLFPEKLSGGQTLYNVYFPTLAILKFWETVKETVSTEVAYSGTFEINVSAKGEDVKVIVQNNWRPDTSSEEAFSVFAGNGKDKEGREKNINSPIVAALRRHIENYMSGKNPNSLIENKKVNGVGVIDALREDETLCRIICDLERDLGIRLSVKIDTIDHSEAVSKARDNKATTGELIKAAEELVKKSEKHGEKMSFKEAYRRVQLESVPDVKETRLDINVPKDFKGTLVTGGFGGTGTI